MRTKTIDVTPGQVFDVDPSKGVEGLRPAPWEETWNAHWDSDYVVTLKRENGMHVGQFPAGRPDGVACAKLAAAAPEMARLLLDLEWSGSDEEGAHCPKCYASAYGAPIYDADGGYHGCEDGTHKPDCAWVAVLQKAGAR